ncbi:MAG: PSD1 and planctomycete cytochrome C domain-containing protein [Planctomycetaceae bacterium]|nr:PSD1 and planctomycete cytochrome C domain-containing protein [Planctomycetaceae bacterium]
MQSLQTGIRASEVGVNRQVISLAMLVLLAAGCGLCTAAPPDDVRFNRDVRPILSNNCFYCHGPDPKHREADLRLDTSDGALAMVVVPGRPDKSPLIERVTSHDDDMRMPPPASKKGRLSDQQIAILRRWIEQGAKYEGHWSFLPLAKAEEPAVKNEAWVKNPIDRFILARLEQEGIVPSPEADAATLIRRLSLDLTGLLPTPQEAEQFASEFSPSLRPSVSPSGNEGETESQRDSEKAYAALVERLLNSPHYGERWGRHWLDQARYADSSGYSIDSERQMWPYRDWVIQATNDDMPFDRFTIEQLAGDLLPNPNKGQLVATAFHRNTLINEEGGTDPKQFRHEAVVDRVNTTAAVWLGLTVGCAQCHTHKFDPISHREYYELFAFFNNTTDVNNKGATVSVARGEMFGQIPEPPPPPPELVEGFAQRQAAWEKEQLALVAPASTLPVTWHPLEYVEAGTSSGTALKRLEDNSLLAASPIANHDAYRIVAKTGLKPLAALRLRVLTHDSLPKQGPGRAGNGNFVLTKVTASAAGNPLKLVSARADHEQPEYGVAGTLDDDPQTGWAINVGPKSQAKMNADHEAVFVLATPLAADGPIEIRLLHELHGDYLIGRFALEASETAPPGTTRVDKELAEALAMPPESRSTKQALLVRDAFIAADPQARAAKARREAAAAKAADVMVMKELDQPRETYISLRGDFLRPDKDVGPLSPGGLKAVAPAFPAQAGRTRVDLAKWLVSPENPLTPRVTMNRVWMRYFGRGLVETEEDFGTQGTSPSHPELLDWLAMEFVTGPKSNVQGLPWSMKHMHRLIVMSNTYRQSSKIRPDLAEKDPRNQLLARQERTRVEAEIVRDAALSASGLLDRTIGGPSVRPPQPDGVYAFTQTAKKWTPDTGPARYRRGMYTQFFRSAPYPLFTTFDAPDFSTVCTRRIRSNTPLQALTVANDEAFVEIAQGLAARVIREVPADDSPARLKRAFLLCLCRQPNDRELAALQGYYDRQLAELKQDEARAKQLLPTSQQPNASPATAAAMVLASRAILNTDGFITRE